MKYKVTLNNKTYEVEVEKGVATLVNEYQAVALASTPAPVALASAPVVASSPVAAPAPQATTASNASASAVKAPIAGTVLNIKANAGASVKKGDIVLIIEAMKMENEIVAPRDGTVTAVYVQKGANVATGTALFDIA